jgi:molybdopterin/thiamine biosynthesis adenylyltransferase
VAKSRRGDSSGLRGALQTLSQIAPHVFQAVRNVLGALAKRDGNLLDGPIDSLAKGEHRQATPGLGIFAGVDLAKLLPERYSPTSGKDDFHAARIHHRHFALLVRNGGSEAPSLGESPAGKSFHADLARGSPHVCNLSRLCDLSRYALGGGAGRVPTYTFFMSAAVPPRYAKQALFSAIGPDGQAALARARVLIVGCGATGGVLADALARAGVGQLRLVDRDFVEWTNLQRQILFDERDAAEQTPKAIAAAARLRAINSDIDIEPVVADVGPENILTLLDGCDLLLDGTDNFETRFLLNDAALETRIPWIYSGVIGAHGQTMTIVAGQTACLRCMIESPPDPGVTETCDTAGVIGPAVTALASLSAAQALKWLAGRREPVPPRLLALDVWELTLRTIDTGPLVAAGGCAACGRGERAWLHGAVGSRAAILCGRNAVQITPATRSDLDLTVLAERLATAGMVKRTPYLVRLSAAEPRCELTVFRDGRAIVQGTDDPATARAIYSRLVGL